MQEWKKREQIAGVENAGVSRMERQPEIYWDNLKLLRYTYPYSCDLINSDLYYIIKNNCGLFLYIGGLLAAAFVFVIFW